MLKLSFVICLLCVSEVFAVDNPTTSSMTYQKLLGQINERVLSLEKLAGVSQDNDWLTLDKYASVLIEKANLTGNLANFKLAEEVLEKAMTRAPKGSGPLLTAAKMKFSLHKLSEAEKYLDLISKQHLISNQKSLAVHQLRADIDFQKGQYDKALEGYRECEKASEGICLLNIALFYAKSGGTPEATAIFKYVLSKAGIDDYYSRAWINLQLGIINLEAGKLDQSLQYLDIANKILPGWWLVEEHRAEVLTLKGEVDKAIPLYEKVIVETNLPQYMDALAETYLEKSLTDKAKLLLDKANFLWEAQLKEYPESASGHALDHYLLLNNNEKYLKLAEDNFNTRPNAEARGILANALYLNGKIEESAKQIEILKESSFKSWDSYELAYKIYLSLGEKEKAEGYFSSCLKLSTRCER